MFKNAILQILYLFDGVFEKLLANILIWACFSIIYHIVMKVKDGQDKDGNDILRSISLEEAFYFSATSHYTLGFGDYTPANRAGKIAVILHIFSSWFIALVPFGLEESIKSKINTTKFGIAGY